jgi:hypothetical protein
MSQDKTQNKKQTADHTVFPESDSSFSVEKTTVNEQKAIKSGDAAQNSGSTAEKRKRVRAWFRRQKDEVKAQIVLDFILVLITAMYAMFAAFQWGVLRRQADGIEAQVAAARTQAEAAHDMAVIAANTLKEMQDSGRTGKEQQDRLIGINGDLVRTNQDAVAVTKEATRANRQAMSFTIRPYVEVDQFPRPGWRIDDFTLVDLILINRGNSPAFVDGETKFAFTHGEMPAIDYSDAVPFRQVRISPSGGKVDISIKSRERVTKDQYNAIGTLPAPPTFAHSSTAESVIPVLAALSRQLSFCGVIQVLSALFLRIATALTASAQTTANAIKQVRKIY